MKEKIKTLSPIAAYVYAFVVLTVILAILASFRRGPHYLIQSWPTDILVVGLALFIASLLPYKITSKKPTDSEKELVSRLRRICGLLAFVAVIIFVSYANRVNH